MALNIDIVNSTVINVYETGGVPRSYFGGFGASGKFYPSGTSGKILNANIQYVSSTLDNVPDDYYIDILASSSSSTASPILLNITIVSNQVDNFLTTTFPDPCGWGYAIGDILTIPAELLHGGATGELVFKVISLDIDGLLIVIGGDDYYTKWENLVVGGTSPTSLSDAQSLLANLFSTL